MTAGKLFLRGLLLVVVFTLVAWLLSDVLDRQWMDEQVRNRGYPGYVIFLLAACLLMTVGLSRQLVALLAGYGFGFQAGMLLAMTAVVVACILTYTIARLLLCDYLSGKFSGSIRRIRGFAYDNTFPVTLLFRLLPLGSNWMLNVAAGVTGFRRLPFFTASAIGYLPQMMVFSLIGSGVAVEQPWQVGVALLLGVVALLLAIYLYRQYRLQGHQLSEQLAG